MPIPSTWADHDQGKGKDSSLQVSLDQKKKKKHKGVSSTTTKHQEKRKREEEDCHTEQSVWVPTAAAASRTLPGSGGSCRSSSSAEAAPPSLSSRSELLIDQIKEALRSSRSFQRETKLYHLNLNTILSSTSYRAMMRQAFGSSSCIMPDETDSLSQQQHEGSVAHRLRVVIPTVTRAFEESYMREALEGERQCARGLNCECRFIDPMMPFVCVEFLTLEELCNPPAERQMCVICCRKETQFLFYDMLFNSAVYNATIQKFGNLSGQGEYAHECLLRCTRACDLACMPKPIMSHQRNRYVVVEDEKHRCLALRQLNVSPEDYPIPSKVNAAAAAAGQDRQAKQQQHAASKCQAFFHQPPHSSSPQ